MVDAKAKGARGEIIVRDLLRTSTGFNWERTPHSGALDIKHKLKGDLYIPNSYNRFCIEVKNYKESSLNDKILTTKTNNIIIWWNKIREQAKLCDQEPLLFFKYDRSKVFVVTELKPQNLKNFLYFGNLDCYIMICEEWLGKETIKWSK